MGRPVVVFDGVWKKFRRGERHDSLRDLVPSILNRFRSLPPDSPLADSEFWGLRDVSFQVEPGEALGIIGTNGAGKSTALKLLTRILKPTRGRCSVHGRIGALIEIAAGFHPDLTGRENIYLQGAIMGMKRAEITEKLDAIVDFAGTGSFIDTPVKRFSSGMNARLGFAIAAHLDPDVLLIDEVLSVGDIGFQRRCQERMQTFRRNGVAIVFVSHHLESILALCQQTLLLQNGRALALGPSMEVISHFASSLYASDSDRAEASIDVEFDRTRMIGHSPALKPGSTISFLIRVRFAAATERALIGVVIRETTRNLYVYGVTSERIGVPEIRAEAGDTVVVPVEFDAHLTRGVYSLEVNVYDCRRQQHLAVLHPAKYFTIDEDTSYEGIANLYLRLDSKSSTRHVDPGLAASSAGPC